MLFVISSWVIPFHHLDPVTNQPTVGAELAETGTIKNFGVANELALEMRQETSTEWDYYKRKYQPIYNKV